MRLTEDMEESPQVELRKRPEPEEVRIYVKQLKKALKFLPLGSRAYYYISGEVARANAELRISEKTTSTHGQHSDTRGPSSS